MSCNKRFYDSTSVVKVSALRHGGLLKVNPERKRRKSLESKPASPERGRRERRTLRLTGAMFGLAAIQRDVPEIRDIFNVILPAPVHRIIPNGLKEYKIITLRNNICSMLRLHRASHDKIDLLPATGNSSK